jgi:integrase/recombinase XerD
LDCHRYAICRFFEWLSPRRESIASISPSDADAYIEHNRLVGWSMRTCIDNVSSIRAFFRFAESRCWSSCGISRTLRHHAPALRNAAARCPRWKQVGRMLDWLDCSNPSHCRAKAILLLATVYGLRRSELIRLTLDDIDWRNAVITVRRAKRGRVQQFPSMREVGEAIIRYLRDVRQPTRFRNVFMTLHSPYRPALNLGSAIHTIMTASGAFDQKWGLHALRHACATQLLRQGTSLRDIADFRGLGSVSIYAHCDPRALRAVADMDISAIL